jgi:molybdopterin converting factor small subunit
MKVQVRLFARYREAAGRDRVELDLPEGGTVEAAWEAVTSRFPSLSAYRPFTLFAVGNDYVGPERSLRPGEELCLFPPVSGGSDDLVDLVAAAALREGPGRRGGGSGRGARWCSFPAWCATRPAGAG